jgi:peptidoglycan-N-acetylglucosamine deacetylase
LIASKSDRALRAKLANHCAEAAPARGEQRRLETRRGSFSRSAIASRIVDHYRLNTGLSAAAMWEKSYAQQSHAPAAALIWNAVFVLEAMTMTAKDIQVCINPHFDAVALWIGSFGGADSPCDISRGVFAAKRGVPRLLDLFKRYGIKTTWGVTGHSMESFPKAGEMIIEDGHEIGIHGYTHENPLAMTREQETEVLDKTFDIIKRMSGKAPVGYMAPWWELSPNTVELLLARGIQYDGSLMEDDYHPYYLRVGDKWTKIDYKKKASEWMVPWKAGKEIDLVELPASWLLDDAPPTMFVKAFPNSHGWVTGRALEEIWKDQFDWVYRNHDYAIYPLCIHPDSAGKPHVLMLLERLIDHMMAHSGVRMVTFAEMAADFRKRCPFGSGKDPGGRSGL